MTKFDPIQLFKLDVVNVGYRIAKRSFNCSNQLGS
jgi:hypothetical protein